MTKKRTHKPEVNQKLQSDFRDRKRQLGLVPVGLWLLPEDKPKAKNLEKKSEDKAKMNHKVKNND